MRRNAIRLSAAAVLAALVWQSAPVGAGSAEAQPYGDGKRQISYQHQQDLFYNYYAGPGPCSSTAAGMYPAPGPVPANVGHTYVTYQPLMPHEFTYKHHRSYYTYNPGAGWRRTNVRYGTAGLRVQDWWHKIHYPRTNGMWALHNDLHFPGLRD